MSFFAKLKESISGNINKFSGRTDFLEAVCASCALVAAADGSIDDSEIETTSKAIASNPKLSAAFSAREIERVSESMLRRAQSGRTGRMGLYKEIDDVSGDTEMAETVFLAALDVADADGSVDEKEQAVIKKLAERLRLDPSKYDV